MFGEKKIDSIVAKLAKKHQMPRALVHAIIRSQFECAREATEEKKNIRFPYLMLLYNRENKNPEYLKHRKNLKNE
jgi:hypothetical protein